MAMPASRPAWSRLAAVAFLSWNLLGLWSLHAQAAMTLDFRADLPAIRVPVLAIVPYYASDYAATGISEETKRAYYASLLRGVAALDVVTIAPARHFVMLDQPEALIEAIRKFVDAR